MKSPIAKLLIFGMLLQCVATPSRIKSPRNEAKPPATPLLWKVQVNGKQSYLFGTIHLGVSASTLPACVWKAFSRSELVVTEVDLASIDREKMLQDNLLPQGQSIDKMLPESYWQKLLNNLGASIPRELVAQLKPHVIISLLMVKLSKPTLPMDGVFARRAKETGKKQAFLEEYHFQNKLLEGVMDISFLKYMLDDITTTRRSLRDLVKAYNKGDLNYIYSQIVAPNYIKFKFTRHQLNLLLDQRNILWVTKITSYLKKYRSFIAVGAGHLPGNSGLLKLLGDKGHRPIRVFCPDPT